MYTALSSVINENSTAIPVDASQVKNALIDSDPVYKMIEEQNPTRSKVSKFQVARKAKLNDMTEPLAIAALIKSEASFTEERLEKELRAMNDLIYEFANKSIAVGVNPELALSKDFLLGIYNPASGKLNVEFLAHSELGVVELKKVLAELQKKNPALTKKLQIKIVQGNFSQGMVALNGYGPEVLLDSYKNVALKYGGLASSETISGNLKFTKTYSDIAVPNSLEELSYFPPDKEAENLLRQLVEKDSTESLEEAIGYINDRITRTYSKISYSVVDELADGSLAQIVPEIRAEYGLLNIHLKITKKGLSMPAVVAEEIIHLIQITNTNYVNGQVAKDTFFHPYQWAEIVANARAGSKKAILKLATVEKEAATALSKYTQQCQSAGILPAQQIGEMNEYLKVRLASSEARLIELTKAARPELKAKEQAWAKTKIQFDKLEKGDVKFNDLVEKGDRKGVRKMLDKYLPWDLMEPSEKVAWTEWLDALEKPDQSKLRLTFRGMDDDYVFRTPKGAPFFMSTVMTKNQGSYTRRLRSLATMRDKIGATSFKSLLSQDVKSPTTLTMFFRNHSYDPKGSPFLSTSNASIATSFGNRRRAALLIDERRLIYNVVSNYDYESELLVPLVIFPDEVLHFEEVENGSIDSSKFRKAVEAKIGRVLTIKELNRDEDLSNSILKNYVKLQPILNPDPLNIPQKSGGVKDCLIDYLKMIAK